MKVNINKKRKLHEEDPGGSKPKSVGSQVGENLKSMGKSAGEVMREHETSIRRTVADSVGETVSHMQEFTYDMASVMTLWLVLRSMRRSANMAGDKKAWGGYLNKQTWKIFVDHMSTYASSWSSWTKSMMGRLSRSTDPRTLHNRPAGEHAADKTAKGISQHQPLGTHPEDELIRARLNDDFADLAGGLPGGSAHHQAAASIWNRVWGEVWGENALKGILILGGAGTGVTMRGVGEEGSALHDMGSSITTISATAAVILIRPLASLAMKVMEITTGAMGVMSLYQAAHISKIISQIHQGAGHFGALGSATTHQQNLDLFKNAVAAYHKGYRTAFEELAMRVQGNIRAWEERQIQRELAGAKKLTELEALSAQSKIIMAGFGQFRDDALRLYHDAMDHFKPFGKDGAGEYQKLLKQNVEDLQVIMARDMSRMGFSGEEALQIVQVMNKTKAEIDGAFNLWAERETAMKLKFDELENAFRNLEVLLNGAKAKEVGVLSKIKTSGGTAEVKTVLSKEVPKLLEDIESIFKGHNPDQARKALGNDTAAVEAWRIINPRNGKINNQLLLTVSRGGQNVAPNIPRTHFASKAREIEATREEIRNIWDQLGVHRTNPERLKNHPDEAIRRRYADFQHRLERAEKKLEGLLAQRHYLRVKNPETGKWEIRSVLDSDLQALRVSRGDNKISSREAVYFEAGKRSGEAKSGRNEELAGIGDKYSATNEVVAELRREIVAETGAVYADSYRYWYELEWAALQLQRETLITARLGNATSKRARKRAREAVEKQLRSRANASATQKARGETMHYFESMLETIVASARRRQQNVIHESNNQIEAMVTTEPVEVVVWEPTIGKDGKRVAPNDYDFFPTLPQWLGLKQRPATQPGLHGRRKTILEPYAGMTPKKVLVENPKVLNAARELLITELKRKRFKLLGGGFGASTTGLAVVCNWGNHAMFGMASENFVKWMEGWCYGLAHYFQDGDFDWDKHKRPFKTVTRTGADLFALISKTDIHNTLLRNLATELKAGLDRGNARGINIVRRTLGPGTAHWELFGPPKPCAAGSNQLCQREDFTNKIGIFRVKELVAARGNLTAPKTTTPLDKFKKTFTRGWRMQFRSDFLSDSRLKAHQRWITLDASNSNSALSMYHPLAQALIHDIIKRQLLPLVENFEFDRWNNVVRPKPGFDANKVHKVIRHRKITCRLAQSPVILNFMSFEGPELKIHMMSPEGKPMTWSDYNGEFKEYKDHEEKIYYQEHVDELGQLMGNFGDRIKNILGNQAPGNTVGTPNGSFDFNSLNVIIHSLKVISIHSIDATAPARGLDEHWLGGHVGVRSGLKRQLQQFPLFDILIDYTSSFYSSSGRTQKPKAVKESKDINIGSSKLKFKFSGRGGIFIPSDD